MGNLILQSPPEHVAALTRAAQEAAVRPIRGIFGPRDQVRTAMEALRLKEDELQLDGLDDLFSLRLGDLAVPEILSAGKVRGRRIERRDLDQATAWRIAYCVEALGAEETAELAEKSRGIVEGSYERGDTWVLEDEGRLVACTSFNAAIAEAVQVGGVWTPPELRGRGYGRAVVAVSLLDAHAESVEHALLFTAETNVPAIRAYESLGFRRIGDYRLVFLRKPRAGSVRS
jgi:ribosomal protein S18 acetylase RimI-like enzyme